jgi:hypothetical protein
MANHRRRFCHGLRVYSRSIKQYGNVGQRRISVHGAGVRGQVHGARRRAFHSATLRNECQQTDRISGGRVVAHSGSDKVPGSRTGRRLLTIRRLLLEDIELPDPCRVCARRRTGTIQKCCPQQTRNTRRGRMRNISISSVTKRLAIRSGRNRSVGAHYRPRRQPGAGV